MGEMYCLLRERNESWNIYQVKLEREEEKFFYASTILRKKLYCNRSGNISASIFSDGKEVATGRRIILRVMNLESKGENSFRQKV